MITELEALRERHSVRHYISQPLPEDAIEKIRAKIASLNMEGELNMQLVVNEQRAFSGNLLSYGKFSGVSNYILVIGKPESDMEYRAGYYGEKLVIYLQQLGLRTCWVGLTYKKVPEAFKLNPGEKIVCCIAIGYGKDNGVQHKMKLPEQVSNISANTPGWFAEGVQAALLSPTAINQQKFHFDYIAPAMPGEKARVKPSKGFSLVGYTKIDLGIAMCNFEIGAGKENFIWENPS